MEAKSVSQGGLHRYDDLPNQKLAEKAYKELPQ